MSRSSKKRLTSPLRIQYLHPKPPKSQIAAQLIFSHNQKYRLLFEEKPSVNNVTKAVEAYFTTMNQSGLRLTQQDKEQIHQYALELLLCTLDFYSQPHSEKLSIAQQHRLFVTIVKHTISGILDKNFFTATATINSRTIARRTILKNALDIYPFIPGFIHINTFKKLLTLVGIQQPNRYLMNIKEILKDHPIRFQDKISKTRSYLNNKMISSLCFTVGLTILTSTSFKEKYTSFCFFSLLGYAVMCVISKVKHKQCQQKFDAFDKQITPWFLSTSNTNTHCLAEKKQGSTLDPDTQIKVSMVGHTIWNQHVIKKLIHRLTYLKIQTCVNNYKLYFYIILVSCMDLSALTLDNHKLNLMISTFLLDSPNYLSIFLTAKHFYLGMVRFFILVIPSILIENFYYLTLDLNPIQQELYAISPSSHTSATSDEAIIKKLALRIGRTENFYHYRQKISHALFCITLLMTAIAGALQEKSNHVIGTCQAGDIYWWHNLCAITTMMCCLPYIWQYHTRKNTQSEAEKKECIHKNTFY